ncbi:MAG: hypothetical protein Q8L86_04620 [Vicinamibacterales bacterium]|nr:hypothetical protein [Vicinamibacterales bacterium]
MEFRLVYQGLLPSASPRKPRGREKHEIRRVLGRQLAELWKAHPRLRSVAEGAGTHHVHLIAGAQYRQGVGKVYNRCDRRFVPLITRNSGVGCSLDVLFLRRDEPGSLIGSGGDIDNRIKVLFDALRLPTHERETTGTPEDDDDPFYCLLEDDSLITEVRVTTDRLLLPREGVERVNDVHLVIRVKTTIVNSGVISALSF